MDNELPEDHPLNQGKGQIHYSPRDENLLANQEMGDDAIVRALAIGNDWTSHSGSIPNYESASASIGYIVAENSLAAWIAATLGTAHPIWTDMICLTVDFEHNGSWECDGSDWAQYAVTANYGPYPDEELGQESISISAQAYTFPTKALEGSSPGDNISEEKGDAPMATIMLPQAAYKIKFAKVASLPKATLIAAVGKVNDALWHGWAAETCLFLGCNTETKYTSTGVEYSVDYDYQVNFAGWNKVYRPQNAKNAKWEDTNPELYDDVGFAATFGW